MRSITLLLVLTTLLCGVQTLSAISWIGQGQTNAWSDPGNWSGNQVPGAGDLATVGNGFTPYIDYAVSVGSLVLDNAYLHGPGSVTVTASFSADSSNVAVPLTLTQGAAGLLTGYYSLNGDLTNYGEINCNANVTFGGRTIINHGTFNAVSGFNFNVYTSPARFHNYGIFKKPFPAGTFTAGVEVTNFSTGDIVAEMGELNISGNLINHGDVMVSGGATVRNHEVHAQNGSTISGAGTFIINGNGFFAENTSPIAIDIAELELDGQVIGGTGAVTINQHLNWVSGGILAAVTFSSTCVVDVVTSGGHGITNTTTNNGTMNVNANMTFSTGTLINNNLLVFNGAYSIGVYNASAGIFNHGTVQKPAGQSGLFSLNLALTNEPDGTLLVQDGELYIGHLENTGDIAVSAGAVLRTHTFHLYDGATLSGAGMLKIQNNGLFANNTNPLTIDIAEIELDGQQIGGAGALTLSGHLVWLSGALATTVTLAVGSTVDINPGGSGAGITGLVSNNGTMNINANMTFSYGNLTNNGLILLNGPHSIGIYAATQGIFNYGIVKKPAASAGVFNMGIPLNNEPGGSVVVENGELYVNSIYYARGSLSVSAGAIFRAHNIQVYDGALFSGAGTMKIIGGGLTANNTSTVVADITTVDMESSIGGTGALQFNGQFNWLEGYINNTIIIGSAGAFNVGLAAYYGIGGLLTVNGVMNANAPFFNNGTINNSGTLNLNHNGGIGGSGQINNTGTMIKHIAAGDVTLQNPLVNSGLAQCPGGQLFLFGLSNSGTIEIAAGATVKQDGYGQNSFDAGCNITGQGTFILASNMAVNADLNIDVQYFVLQGYPALSSANTLTFTQNLDWSGGQIENTVVIASGATLNLTGTDPKYLLGTLSNSGTVNCDANLEFGFSAILNNNNTFHLNGDNTLGAPYNYYNAGQFNNTGTLDKTSAGTASFNLVLANLNNGQLQVTAGTLEVGQLDNDGSVNIAAGALLIVRAGSNLVNGTLSGSGTLRIADSGWHLTNPLTLTTLSLEIDANLSGDAGAALNIGGTASWLSGDIGAQVNIGASGTLNISGYAYRVLQAPLTNAGTVNCGATFSSDGNIGNSGNFYLTDGGGIFGFGGEIFTNSGLLQMNGSYDSYLYITVVNNGTVDVASSTLHLFEGLENNATLTVQNNALLEISGISSFNAGSSLAGAGSFTVSGGELTLNIDLGFSGETFTLMGDLLGQHELTISTAMIWSNGDIDCGVTINSGATLEINGGGGGGGGGFGSKGYGSLLLKAMSSGQTLSAMITNNGSTTQNGSYYMDGGEFLNNGELNTFGGGIDDDGNGGLLTNNGTWINNYDFSCYVNAVNNGTFSGEGYFIFEPEWTNNGIVSPGLSPGQMTFEHDFDNGSDLQIEMNDNGGAGIGHDYIEAEENIQLGGTLTVTETGMLLNGAYTIMQCNGGPNCLTGTFTTVNLPQDYTLSYAGDAVILTKGAQQVYITPSDTAICAGAGVVLTASAAETYLWSTGETTASIEVYPYYTETYSVTVTFSGGGGAFASAEVTVNPQPYVYIDPYYAYICQGESLTLTAYGGDTYSWSTGETGSVIQVSPTIETTYYVTATDANGCTGSAGVYVYVGDPAVVPEITGVPSSACQTETPFYLPEYQDGYYGTWSGPGVSYNYFDPAGLAGDQMLLFTPYPGQCAAPNTWTINVIVATSWYADTDTDGYGNPTSSTTACTQPAGYVADNTDCDDTNAAVHPDATETCNGIDDDCDGLIDEGVGATWYADTDNDGYGDPASPTTACSQPAGYVADNTDCDDTNAAIHPGAAETCNGADDDCDGLSDEGVGATWYADTDNDGYGDPANPTTACSQPAGYVADNTDCDDTNAAIHPGATETCNGADDDCDGLSDEDVGATWYADTDNDGYGDPANPTTACSQPAGYVADNTDCDDANGEIHPGATEVCNGIDDNCDGSVDETAGVAINPVNITHVACSGGNTGAIDITVTGGTAPYTFHWSNNKTTEDIANLVAGTYTVTVINAQGCSATASATVNPKLKLTLSKTNTTCNGGSDGTATATVTGGTPPYSYLWETGATTPTITGLTPGSYGVTIMDELGCSRSGNIGVGQPPAIGISSQTTAVSCNGEADGTINITVNNGVSPFSFAWNDGGTTEDRDNLGAGAFTVTVTDANGCTRAKSFNINQPAALTLNCSADNISCNGYQNGEITATAGGGVKFPTDNLCNGERYCYTWSNGANSRAIGDLGVGTYSLTVSDANGCTITGSATITEPDTLLITQIEEEPLPNGKFKLTVTAAGGATPYKYKRYPGMNSYQNSNILNNVPAGEYLIIVRDKNLCEDTVSVSVPGAGNFQRGGTANRADQSAEAETEIPDMGLTLFPNPAGEVFNLFIDTEFTTGVLRIFDLGGRLILEQTFSPGTYEYQFDLSGWQSGVYFVRVQLDNRNSLKKLVVETP